MFIFGSCLAPLTMVGVKINLINIVEFFFDYLIIYQGRIFLWFLSFIYIRVGLELSYCLEER